MNGKLLQILAGALALFFWVAPSAAGDRARDTRTLEVEVQDVDLALERAERWLREVGHFPVPYGVRQARHGHTGPKVSNERVVAVCTMRASKQPRDAAAPSIAEPAGLGRSDDLSPAPVSNQQTVQADFRWVFKVGVAADGNAIQITSARHSNPEMARVLARYIETGSAACLQQLEWLVDPPRHQPVDFDPAVHRLQSPNLDTRRCLAEAG